VTVVDNLFAALRSIPALPGAKCVGRHELFESPDPGDIANAVELCSHCPARLPCAQWVESLPPTQRPAGVVGGRVYVTVTPDQTRQRRKTPAA
jgi:WhiB family redox-sensing transcriptional regulator